MKVQFHYLKIYALLIISLSGLIDPLQAQNQIAEIGEEGSFTRGLELLDREKYGAARNMFEAYLAREEENLKTIDAEYYLAYSALKLFHEDGTGKLASFIHKYPDHPKANHARYELGNFYFNEENYNKAVEYLKAANGADFVDEKRIKLNFRLGYAYFSRQQFGKASTYFNKIKREDSQYMHAASYYAGYIAYRNENYDKALLDLERAAASEGNNNIREGNSYQKVIPYMIANIYYKTGRYDEVIAYGEEILQGNVAISNEQEVRLLLGEAYFRKNNYAKAGPHLEAYARDNNPDAPVNFRLAYSHYQNGANEKAIQRFKEVVMQEDTIGQFSSYYLGILYLKQDNKKFAATAFEQAASAAFENEVKEESLFKLGKVYYSLENYNQAINSLEKFINVYPQSSHISEANDLLSKAYLNTNNYDRALSFIEGLAEKSPKIKAAYQKVTFHKGTQEFNNARYYNAVQFFNKSLQYPRDKEIVLAAHFWKGEAFSIGKKYEDAINAYAGVFRNYDPNEGNNKLYEYHLKSRYGIGYAYYNTKQYEKALVHFKKYVDELENSSNKMYYDDALIRLADCYYINKTYGTALQYYKRAIRENNPEEAYAYLQQGIILNIQGRIDEARNAFNQVIVNYPDSRHHDDAIYQNALMNLEAGSYQEAIQGFTSLLKSKPQSSYIPYALQKRATAYFNLQQNDKAAGDYKRLVEDYTTHQVANGALRGLQEIMAIQGNSGEFDQYLARYKEANPDNEELASIEFESAKNLYFNQQYDRAVSSFKDYINNYPDNSYTPEARYFIAESFYRAGDYRQALDFYYDVVRGKQSSRLNRSIQRVADLEARLGNHEEAIVYYKRLENLADTRKDKYNAWQGLMTTYYELSPDNTALLDSVETYANIILEKGNVSANAENQALLYLGKASYARGNYEKAIEDLRKTTNAANDENGAEAQYMIADIQYQQGNYKESIETLFDLNKNFSMYEKWLGRSFLLIADNYIGMGEQFQAKATLKSIIENSPVSEIVNKAETRLMTLQEKEQKADSIQQEMQNQMDSVGEGSVMDSTRVDQDTLNNREEDTAEQQEQD